MGQPVKISSSLILDARLMAEATQRSIAGQIEFWARIGQALEPILRGDQVVALCRSGKTQPLSTLIKSINSRTGRDRLKAHLKSLPYPHYEPSPKANGLLVRVEANGKRTVGKFVNRKFQAVKAR